MKISVNAGSGQRPFSSTPEMKWINVDYQEKWNPDIMADISSLPMIEEGSVDYFVLHHTLEHFGCGEGAGAIKEAYRVLKPGGSLLVFVPDMRALAKAWLDGRITDQIYFTNVYGAYMGDEADRHRWGYTGSSLCEFLGSVAPWTIKPFDFRSIPGADIAQDWWILGVEAIK